MWYGLLLNYPTYENFTGIIDIIKSIKDGIYHYQYDKYSIRMKMKQIA